MSLTSSNTPPVLETSPLDAHHLEHHHDLSTLIGRVNDRVRRNPLPSLAGAAAFGAAVTYMICSRSCRSWRNDDSDGISDSVHRAITSIKFW
jgi:hypothetical protein